jgi:hypothetical protein
LSESSLLIKKKGGPVLGCGNRRKDIVDARVPSGPSSAGPDSFTLRATASRRSENWRGAISFFELRQRAVRLTNWEDADVGCHILGWHW